MLSPIIMESCLIHTFLEMEGCIFLELTLRRLNANPKVNFSIFYFVAFVGVGAMQPMLSVYFQDYIGLTGSQIGMIMSITPVVAIIAQPVWGIITDSVQRPRQILTLTVLATAIVGFFYSTVYSYLLLLIFTGLLSVFQSAIIPISDSMAMSYVQKSNVAYGSIRLWGAIGFALSVLVAGWLSDIIGLPVIFYLFALAFLVTAFFAWNLPDDRQSLKVDIRTGVKTLVKMPRFMLFLLTTFMIFGPISANNVYFGILITDVGGTLTGVGIAFLLAAGSEAPFMKFAGSLIHKLGMLPILIVAGIISGMRWLIYFFEPSLYLVYATTITQGLSVGLFIPAALQYVRDISPSSVRATAVSLYAAIGNGLGSWFCTFIGGMILESFGTLHVYLFFTILTLIGIIVITIIMLIDRKKR